MFFTDKLYTVKDKNECIYLKICYFNLTQMDNIISYSFPFLNDSYYICSKY